MLIKVVLPSPRLASEHDGECGAALGHDLVSKRKGKGVSTMVSVATSCCGFSIITGWRHRFMPCSSSWLGHGSVGSRETTSIEGGTYLFWCSLGEVDNTDFVLGNVVLLSSDGGASVVAIA